MRFWVSRGQPKKLNERHLTGWGRLAAYIDKDLSPALEPITQRQLAVLLEAIHLGDGAKQLGQPWTRRSYHITTVNRTFAQRLQSLCVRRGFRCNLADDGRRVVLHIKAGEIRNVAGSGYSERPFLEPSPTLPNERVWCVENRVGTLVVRRNGKVAVVGNCVGRALRTFPGKRDCLVIDVVGVSDRLDLQSLPRLFNLREPPGSHTTVTEALERQAAASRAAAAASPSPSGPPRARRRT
jgi:hypothetical protein